MSLLPTKTGHNPRKEKVVQNRNWPFFYGPLPFVKIPNYRELMFLSKNQMWDIQTVGHG